MVMANICATLFYLFGTLGYFVFLYLQQSKIRKISTWILASGFAVQGIAITSAFILNGHMPVSNLSETLAITAFFIVGVFIFLQFRFRLSVLGVYTAPLASIIMVIGLLTPKFPFPNEQIFKSFWLSAHIVTIFIANAAFSLACGVGILYLLQENAIKKKYRGFFFNRLPSLNLLDASGYALIIFGFTFLTIGLITGFIYANSVWGRFWSGDPKEVWATISWMFYATLLHERITVGWRGKRAALMSIIGFAVLIFTFLGVNFLLKGHHGQFTSFSQSQ